jgi:nicotinamide riboside kinase
MWWMGAAVGIVAIVFWAAVQEYIEDRKREQESEEHRQRVHKSINDILARFRLIFFCRKLKITRSRKPF